MHARFVCFVLLCLAVMSCEQQTLGEFVEPELQAASLESGEFTSSLVAQHSKKCIDVPLESRRTGTDLIQWICRDRPNQRFSFEPVTDTSYRLKNELSQLCLEVGLQARDGLYYVTQETCDSAKNQQFSLKPGGADKVFSLVAEHNGTCLDVIRASRDNRAKLIGYRCHGKTNQAWGLSGYSKQPTPEPEPENRVTVVAAGDIACDPTSDSAYNGGNGTSTRCRMKATARLAESLRPDAVLALGDLQYNTGLYDEFLESYGPSWGRLKSKTYPVPGNHEYGSQNAAGYYKYFGSRAGDPKKGYYSFDVGNWHVIVLNTNSNCNAVSCAAGSAQEKWLRADLAATTKNCVLAAMHHPRYSSGRHGSHGSVAPFWRALVEGGADVLLSGHDHHYERFAPQDEYGRENSSGLRQFVVGTGGKSLYAVSSTRTHSQRIIAERYGVLELSLGENNYDWAFVTESGGRFDVGRASCS